MSNEMTAEEFRIFKLNYKKVKCDFEDYVECKKKGLNWLIVFLLKLGVVDDYSDILKGLLFNGTDKYLKRFSCGDRLILVRLFVNMWNAYKAFENAELKDELETSLIKLSESFEGLITFNEYGEIKL